MESVRVAGIGLRTFRGEATMADVTSNFLLHFHDQCVPDSLIAGVPQPIKFEPNWVINRGYPTPPLVSNRSGVSWRTPDGQNFVAELASEDIRFPIGGNYPVHVCPVGVTYESMNPGYVVLSRKYSVVYRRADGTPIDPVLVWQRDHSLAVVNPWRYWAEQLVPWAFKRAAEWWTTETRVYSGKVIGSSAIFDGGTFRSNESFRQRLLNDLEPAMMEIQRGRLRAFARALAGVLARVFFDWSGSLSNTVTCFSRCANMSVREASRIPCDPFPLSKLYPPGGPKLPVMSALANEIRELLRTELGYFANGTMRANGPQFPFTRVDPRLLVQLESVTNPFCVRIAKWVVAALKQMGDKVTV
jgi:hypothetical protein